MRGKVRVGKALQSFERVITAGDVPGTLSVLTRLQAARGAKPRLVEQAHWAEVPPFVPGLGRPVDAVSVPADWLGAEGAGHAMVLGFRDGAPEARALFKDHGPHRYVARMDLSGPGTATPLGLRWRTLLVLREASLGQTLRAFGWARGAPYPEAHVSLVRRPRQAAVHVLRPDGLPWLTTTPGSPGRLPIPLPPGPVPVDLRATAYGYAESPLVHLDPARAPFVVELVIPVSGQLRVEVEDAKTAAPLPFRLRLVGVETTPPVKLGPDGRAAGALDTALSTGGSLTVTVPPGAYRALISHGPEWSLFDRRVIITGAHEAVIRATLERQAPVPPGWVSCDLHVHAAPSYDSEVTLEDRLAALVAEDVHFAVATDHNHVTDYEPVVRAQQLPIGTATGVEITTEKPSFGHFNAFPFPLTPEVPAGGPPRHEGRTPDDLFGELRALDPQIAIQVNHPRFEGGIGYFDEVGYDPATGEATGAYSDAYDLVEVWNGYDLARPAKLRHNLGEWLAMLSRRKVVATGSSDSHRIRTSWSGYPRTYAYRGDEGVAGVVPALKAGRVFVTNAPMLLVTLNGKGPGEHVRAADGPLNLQVQVRTAGWASVDRLEVYVGERLVEQIELGAPSTGRPRSVRRSLRLQPTAGSFVVVMVHGSAPLDDYFGNAGVLPMAFTNPIWID